MLDPYDAQTRFVPEDDLAVVTWFRTSVEADLRPRPGPQIEKVDWFPLANLPELAWETDRRILSALAREDPRTEPEALMAELRARTMEFSGLLERRGRRYNELMDLYMQELMRGAWINDLLVQVADTNAVADIAGLACRHLASQSDIDLVHLWLPGPADQCESCPWAEHCPKEQCLHLVVEVGESKVRPDHHIQRIPPITGTPAGDTAVRNDLTQQELEGQGPAALQFEGFPLDVGLDIVGVMGLISAEPREAGERRIFQFVARYLGAAIKNARLHQELKRSDQVKRIFIDKMSNELKTPLTVILGYAELLKEDREAAEDEYGAEGARAIERAGRDLFDVVESILFMTKLESGRTVPKKTRCDIGEVLGKMLDQHRAEAEKKNLKLSLTGPREVVWADRQWVERICSELVANGVKFTEHGEIKVTIGADGEPDAELADAVADEARPATPDAGESGNRAPERMVTITVEDTGIGIAKTGRARIFEPFTQGTRVEDDYQVNLHYGGLGVGLPIARTLAVLSGGSLECESHVGHGSKFTLVLPRYAASGE